MAILSFKRIEKKYIVTEEQKNELIAIISEYMELDPFCKNQSTYRIQNIYYLGLRTSLNYFLLIFVMVLYLIIYPYLL